jgi:hypothetical protein
MRGTKTKLRLRQAEVPGARGGKHAALGCTAQDVFSQRNGMSVQAVIVGVSNPSVGDVETLPAGDKNVENGECTFVNLT